MSKKRKSTTSKSGPFVYIAFILVVLLIGTLAYALATEGSACGGNNAYREWRFIPPGWECPTSTF